MCLYVENEYGLDSEEYITKYNCNADPLVYEDSFSENGCYEIIYELNRYADYMRCSYGCETIVAWYG